MRSNGIYHEIKHCTFTALRQYLTVEKLFGFDKNHCKRREKKFCWLIDKPQKFFAPLIRRKINSSNSGKFPIFWSVGLIGRPNETSKVRSPASKQAESRPNGNRNTFLVCSHLVMPRSKISWHLYKHLHVI